MGRLERDTAWEGEVFVTGDVLVPAGVTLRIHPGTRVCFADRPRWACSVFWRSQVSESIEATMREMCDLVVLGCLDVLGTAKEPVHLGVDSAAWGGITCLERGAARLHHATLEGSPHFAVLALDDATVSGEESRCRGCEFGLWAWGSSRVTWRGGSIQASRCSVICCEGARAHLTQVGDASDEGVAAMDWALVRVDRGHFTSPRKHNVVARHRSWIKLSHCDLAEHSLADIVRLDDARVQVVP